MPHLWPPHLRTRRVRRAEIRIYDAQVGRLVKTLTRPTKHSSGDFAWAQSWSPDGSRLATGHRTGCLCLWDTTTWDLVNSVWVGGAPVGTIAWSPSGSRLATRADRDYGRNLGMFDRDANLVKEMDIGSRTPTTLCWLEEGRIAVAGFNHEVTIWDVDTASLVASAPIHSAPITTIVASKNGKCILSLDDEGHARYRIQRRLCNLQNS